MGMGKPRGSSDRHLSEINMVPLIDVMLVLLVIFIVAAPMLTHAVKVDLPQASTAANSLESSVQLAIRDNGDLYWNGEHVTRDALEHRMRDAALSKPVPELRIYADRLTSYERVAQAMAQASRLGLTRIGFVTTPEL